MLEEMERNPASEQHTKSTAQPASGWEVFALFVVCAVGFVLPVIALVVETLTHMCADIFVDPIPTWWHIGMVILVATVNFLGWRAMSSHKAGSRFLPIGIGMALGVSTFYALVFAPLTPLFIFAIMFAGLGILGLAPVLSLLSGIMLAYYVRKHRRENQAGPIAPGILQGFGLATLAVVALEGPVVATHYGLVQAQSPDAEKSRAAIRLIRNWGSESTVLRDCYEHTRSVSDISWCLLRSSDWVSISDARKIYYRAYGRPFNSVPRPTRVKLASLDETRWTDWDYEVAGDQVAGRAAGVSLVSSEITGDMNADAAASREQWTMVFSNSSLAQQEARAQLKLPPGGVVSGVTLWINGKPQEAAFGERKLVRAAYQNVVSHKRDPLLVTSSGPDRVMVQCFPVPPKVASRAGEMKIRITITAPCKLTNKHTSALFLPRIVEKNFAVSCPHHFALTSDKPLQSDRLRFETDTWHGSQLYKGTVSDNVLSTKGVWVEAKRPPNIVNVWSQAVLPDNNKYITAIYSEASRIPISRLLVVLDGSKGMAGHVDEIRAGLSTIPADIQTSVIFASDERANIANDVSTNGTQPLSVVLRDLKRTPFVGGPANEPFLAKAYRIARHNSSTAILWIHGPQPVAAEGSKTLNLKNHAVTLYDMEIESGPNRILDSNMNDANVEVVPRSDNLAQDLQQLFESWQQYNRQMVYAPTLDPPGGNQDRVPSISDELVSLWAFNETKSLLRRGHESEAIKLASRYRLVTPVTGAVVLETKADYKRNGIDPDNPDKNASAPAFNMGAAPEPEENLLIAVALTFIAWQIWKKRLQSTLAA